MVADPRLGAPRRFDGANVLRGLGAGRTGRLISLNLELDDPNIPYGRPPFSRTLRLHNDVRPFQPGRRLVINDDQIQVALQGSSQWDSFAHLGVQEDGRDDVFFGGYGLDETSDGAPAHLGIQALGPAIVARGVLVDLVAQHDPGAQFLPEGMRVDREGVEAALGRQNTEVKAGDAILLYTGFERRRASLGGRYPEASAGIDGSTVPLWRELDPIALIGDNPALEATPMDYSVHIGVLRELGVPIGELWALDELALACREQSRYEFTLVSVPLSIHGAFGSTANAVAIL